MSDRPDLRAASTIRDRIGAVTPKAALVLGSGLGPLADRIEGSVRIPYAEIPDFPEVGVDGHDGEIVFGRLGGLDIMAFRGRVHAYEGRIDAMAVPVRTARALGADFLYLTCAAGALRPDWGPGTLMTLSDHINLMGGNPLVGPNDPEIGPRFPPLAEAYDPDLRALQARAAAELGQPLMAGVYCAWLGPSFETPAEVRALMGLGADAVGMSTVPECILARHCGLKVTATALITNLGVGLSPIPVDHSQTLRAAEEAGGRLGALIERALAECAARP